MRTEPEVRMRLNTFKLVRAEKKKNNNFDDLDSVVCKIHIEELEWMLE